MTGGELRKIKILCVIMIWLIAIFIPLYWYHEPARQEAAETRIKRESMDRGARIYASHCVVCHQMTGTGISGKILSRTALDEDVLFKTVSRGRRGTAMPTFGDQEGGPLKNFEIMDVINFIRNWDQPLLESAAAALKRAHLAR